MRVIEENNFHVVDKPLDAIDEVRQKSKTGDVGEEPFYICNISDIIQKHRVWQQRMPRVLPFYGKLIETEFTTSATTYSKYSEYHKLDLKKYNRKIHICNYFFES